MKNILFLAPFPTEYNIKDGMVNRVNAIDQLFDDVERVYLFVSLKNFKKECYTKDLATVYNLNIILHFWTILHLLHKSNYIYIHSIYMIRFIWLFLRKGDRRLTLDIHGVVPDEERSFKGNYLRSIYYFFVEKWIFRKIDNAVCVTNSMRQIYIVRYPWYKGNYIIYSIMPHDLRELSEQQIRYIEQENSSVIEILYSGGIQNWQNIDLMLDTIQNNLSPQVHYTILTGDKEAFVQKIKMREIDSQYISVETREPSELWKDYLRADYAFILRDDNIVNNVANPTKMVEYLFYGLVPIILSPNIGDYKDLGYEYLPLTKFDVKQLEKVEQLNSVNRCIARKLYENNRLVNLKETILG